MRTLARLYEEIGLVADFCEIKIIEPNTEGHFSTRPLHVAAVWGDCEAIEILVKAGARINEKGEHGFTPLMEAVAQGNTEAVKLLVQLGAKPIKNDDEQSPNEYAEISGKHELTEWLKQNGL